MKEFKCHENENVTSVVMSITTTLSPQGQRLSASCDHLRNTSLELEKLILSRPNDGVCQLGGRAAEIHHANTFMADAASKGKDNLSIVIGPAGGVQARGSADLTVLEDGAKVAEAGLKYYKSAPRTTVAQSNVWDHGRQKIVASEQLDQVRETASKYSRLRQDSGNIYSNEYADTAQNATDRLRHGGVESTPLTKSGSIDIVKKPEIYTKQAFNKELVSTMKNGAAAGGAICSVISAVTNASAYNNKEISGGQAVTNVIIDTSIGTVKGAAVGGAGVMIKGAMAKGALSPLTKTTVPFAFATTGLDVIQGVGSEMCKYSRGEIDGEEAICNAVKHTGKAVTRGATAWAGAEAGAALGSFLGPVGTFVGGLGGGTIGYFFGESLF